MGRPALSPFAETRPLVYTREELDEREATQRAVVLGLLCALISALLSIGAIASLMMIFS